MNEGIVSLTGAGKTYTAVNRALKHMAMGGCVTGNVLLHLDPWVNEFPAYHGRYRDDQGNNAGGVRWFLRKRYNWEYQEGQYRYIPAEEMRDLGRVVRLLPRGNPSIPVLAIFDEAADTMGSEDRARTNKVFFSLMRHQRKIAIDFLFVIQAWLLLDSRIRQLLHYVWTVTNMQTFRVPGLRLRAGLMPGLGSQIHVCQWSAPMYDMHKGRMGGVDSVYSGWLRKDQDVFGCYETEQLHYNIPLDDSAIVDFRGAGSLASQDDPGISWLSLGAGVGVGALGCIMGLL